MSKHTDGPWEVRLGKTGDFKIFVRGARPSDGCVATVRVPCGMEAVARKNADLIAAAPDLLAVLQKFSNCAPNDVELGDRAVLIALSDSEVLAMRAAIAKAVQP